MRDAIEKADVLIEALRWIRQFRGKTTVIKLGGSVMEDARFDGNGCAISQASASLMTTAVRGKTPAGALELFRAFHQMVTGSPVDAPDARALGAHSTDACQIGLFRAGRRCPEHDASHGYEGELPQHGRSGSPARSRPGFVGGSHGAARV